MEHFLNLLFEFFQDSMETMEIGDQNPQSFIGF